MTIVQRAMALVKPQFRLDLNHGVHGVAHWSRVWTNARKLCREMGLDPTVPCWFAFLHDSQRVDEDDDHGHGERAAKWIDEIRPQLRLGAADLRRLKRACRGHSDGDTKAHPIVQVCWDADRLDLGRVGIRPSPARLCTAAAKRQDVIERAWRQSRKL